MNDWIIEEDKIMPCSSQKKAIKINEEDYS